MSPQVVVDEHIVPKSMDKYRHGTNSGRRVRRRS